MKTFAKKSLSVVLAMLMALSTLTVGAFSVFAAELSEYTPITEGTTAVAKTAYSFTPGATGFYNISLATVKDGKSAYSKFDVSTKDKNGDIDTYVAGASAYEYDTYAARTGANETGTIREAKFAPAQRTVKLAAGETYYIDLSSSSIGNGLASALTVAKTEFTYSFETVQTDVTYVSYYDYNTATDDWDIPVYSTNELTTGIAAAITGYCGTSTSVVIPASINGFAVKYVSLNNTNSALVKRITAVSIPEGVEAIESDAFENFYSLTSVNLPSSLEKIGSYAFSGCHALTGRVTIPANVESVGYRAFYDTAVASADVADKNTEIGNQAFGYKVVLNEATADPTDTTDAKADGFFIIAPAGSLAERYAINNGFTSYDKANCLAGNHPYVVTTVAATLFSKGSKTSVCPVCGATVKKSIAKKTFKISSLKSSKKATMVVKAAKLSGITGYQIQYSTSSKFAKGKTKTVKVKTTKALSKTIKGLKSGKKYYVRVRAYKTSGKKTVYSKFTAVKSVKIKK